MLTPMQLLARYWKKKTYKEVDKEFFDAYVKEHLDWVIASDFIPEPPQISYYSGSKIMAWLAPEYRGEPTRYYIVTV